MAQEFWTWLQPWILFRLLSPLIRVYQSPVGSVDCGLHKEMEFIQILPGVYLVTPSKDTPFKSVFHIADKHVYMDNI